MDRPGHAVQFEIRLWDDGQLTYTQLPNELEMRGMLDKLQDTIKDKMAEQARLIAIPPKP